jgi:hypothetical protein
VRLCALGTDQRSTEGYREAAFVAARSDGLFSLDPPRPEDRPARLSASALATIDAGSKILFSALAALYPDTDDLSATDESRIKRIQFAYYDAVGHASIQLTFDLLNAAEDASEEQRQFDTLIAAQVRQAFHLAVTALVRPLHAARAEERLENGVRFKLKGERMTPNDDKPHLAKQTFAILREVADHATPNDLAQLRTMFLPAPPLSFWKMMATVPREQVDNDACLITWKVVLRGLGNVRHSSKSLGRTLAESEFPEERTDRLLVASGTALPGLIDEALRWLMSHGVEAVDLSALATLGLADALQDAGAVDWMRKKLALDYVRTVDAKARRDGD